MHLHRMAGLCLLAGFAAPALAQNESRPGSALGAIRGRVFDSVAARPIANAEVHAIGADADKPVVAFSDSSGGFLMTGLPAGEYALIFYHDALEDLALARRAVAATVSHDTVDAVLATPSASTVLRATCGQASLRDSTRLIIGRIVDAESDQPRGGAQVNASWTETSIERGLVSRVRTLNAIADAQGRFGICGIPSGVVTVRATSARQESGTLDIDTQDQSVLRLRLAVAANDSVRWTGTGIAGDAKPETTTVVRGTARLSGVVRDVAGRPIANARISVRGGARAAVSDPQGAFALDSLPSGSQLVEWRAIGYSPGRRVMLLRPHEDAAIDLRFDERIAALDPVHISETASAFAKRRERGMGYFLTDEQIARLSPITFSDVARKIPGLRTVLAPLGTVLRWRDGCAPVVYLNGLRVMSGAEAMTNAFMPRAATTRNEGLEEDVDFLVDPRTITGLEVYPPYSAPAQYGVSRCATILIWAGMPPR